MCSVHKITPDLILHNLAEFLESAFYKGMGTQGDRPSDQTWSKNCFFLMMKLSDPGQPKLTATCSSSNIKKSILSKPPQYKDTLYASYWIFLYFILFLLSLFILGNGLSICIDMKIIESEKKLIESLYVNISCLYW